MNPTGKTDSMAASNQWASRPQDQRFQTLEALGASVKARRLLSRSRDIEVSKLKVSLREGAGLVINSEISAVRPSHWAFGQFCQTVGAPAAYLRGLDPALTVDCLNYGLAHNSSREQNKFMTLTDPDGGPGTLQAVTSTTYGRIWDADCVDAVGRIVERSGGKFHNPLAYSKTTGEPVPSGLYGSDHDVFMFMIDGGSRLEAGPRAQLHRGFMCWNSETGARTFGLATFLFNELMRAYGVGLSLRNDGLFCLWRQGNEWPLMPGARLGDAFAGACARRPGVNRDRDQLTLSPSPKTRTTNEHTPRHKRPTGRRQQIYRNH